MSQENGKNGNGPSETDELRDALRNACSHLQDLMAQLNKLKGMDREEIRDLRNDRKAAGRALRKGGRRTTPERRAAGAGDLYQG